MNSYQNQNSKIMELESKLKMQKMKYARKLKKVEELYLNQIDILNKKNYILEKANNFSTYNIEKRASRKLSKLIEEEDLGRYVYVY